MIAAYINGYNSLTVVLGVFESQEKAEEILISLGCKWMTLAERYPAAKNPHLTAPQWWLEQYGEAHRAKLAADWEVSHNTKRHLFFTEQFAEYMKQRNLPWYTTSGTMDENWVVFRPIEMNTIAFGYNDD